MRRLELIPLDPAFRAAIAAGPAAAMLGASGAAAPWTAYLARSGDEIVDTCAFKAPPADGEVEIACLTPAGGEGRGHGRAMAQVLVRLAFAGGVDRVGACALPEDGASPAILTRLGFLHDGISLDLEAGGTWRWVLARQAV